MSATDGGAIVRRYADEIWSSGRLELVDALFAEEFVRHGPAVEGGTIRGREDFKGLIDMYRTAFPDLRVPLDEQVVDGDLVSGRWIVSGTNRGPVLGQEATGRQVSIAGLWLHHVRDGRIAEEWVVYDTLALVQQLGLEPPA